MAEKSLRRADVPEYLHEKFGLTYTPSSLATLACYGRGPSFFRSGRCTYYPIHLVDEWARQHLDPTIDDSSELLPKRTHKQSKGSGR
jgi:hypothetical protein